MSIDDLERDLLRQRTNPLRWIARSKPLWVAAGLFMGTVLFLTANRLLDFGIAVAPADVVIGAGLAILLLYATGSLGPDRYDFSFSDDWYRRASCLPGLRQADQTALAMIAVHNSGTEAISWLRSQRSSQAGRRS